MPKKPPCSPDEVENPRTHYCVKLAGKIGKAIARLAQNIQQKNCPPDQVLNPKTQRCVKRDGKLGKQLAERAKPAAKKPDCPEGTIMNPQTGKCVKRDGKIGRSLLAAQTTPRKQLPYSHFVTLKKGKDTVTVAITFSLAGPKVVHVIENGQTSDVRFSTVQLLLKRYNKVVEAYVINGFKVVKVRGDPHRVLENAITAMNTCRRQGPPDVKQKKAPTFTARDQCQNQDTMIMMDDIMTVPLEKRFKTADGYCFDIEELAQSMISSNTVNNPMTRQILTEQDVRAITTHEGLDYGSRAKVGLIYERLLNSGSTLEALHGRNPKLVEAFVQALNIATVTCMADYTADFAPSQHALSRLGDVMSRFEGADLVSVQQLKNKSGTQSLVGIINSANYTCIHGIGYQLAGVFMNNYATLQLNGAKWLPRLVGIIELDAGKLYALFYNSRGGKVATGASVNVYDHQTTGKMVRLGRIEFEPGTRTIAHFDNMDAFGMMMNEAAELYNTIRPRLQQELHSGATVYTTHEVLAMQKTMAKL